jgi:sugar phosphate isomerase/epimerase
VSAPPRALIVDDEPLARDTLRGLLGRDGSVLVAGECGSGAAAVEAIRRERPDIVFPDVQMPDLDGFSVLERVAGEHVPVVVFVTAYDRYAVRAFDVHAVDYLLKPFDDERFFRALRRAKRSLEGEGLSGRGRALLELLEDLARRAADARVKLGIHPHLNTVVETPEEIDVVMEATDPRLVTLAADTGHIYLAGGDVVGILRKYASRLSYFHFKDGVRPFHRPDFLPNMRELGAGEVDFPGVMRLLAEIDYRGWINVEQDHTTLTPRESCARSMKYVETTLKPLYS